MATLQGKITDVTHRPPESLSSITVKAPSVRVGGGTDLIVSSPATVDFDRGTGDVTISGLTGGLSWLYIEGDGWTDSIALSVADGMTTLVEAVANALGAPGLVDYIRLLADLEGQIGDVAQDAVDAAAENIKWDKRPLSTGEDLNTLRTSGFYIVPSNAVAGSLQNAPSDVSAQTISSLTVKSYANTAEQIWSTLHARSRGDFPVYRRTSDTSGNWTAWVPVSSHVVNLSSGANLLTLAVGSYSVATQAVAETIGTRPADTEAWGPARVEVTSGPGNLKFLTWASMQPANSGRSGIWRRQQDSAGTWSEWRRLDNPQTILLGNGANLLTLGVGTYRVESQTVAETIGTRPVDTEAWGPARVEVTSGPGNLKFLTWESMQSASSGRSGIWRRQQDSTGTWSGWRRVDNPQTVALGLNADVFNLHTGTFTVNTHAIAVSLLNKPSDTAARGQALITVRTGVRGNKIITWEGQQPATSNLSGIWQTQQDTAGNWAPWRRIDEPSADEPSAWDAVNDRTGDIADALYSLRKGMTANLMGLQDATAPVWGWVASPGKELTIPTHEGSGEATHPSVLYFADGWNGYKYWMAHTPYPGGDEAHEDPNIVVSNNGESWQVPAGLTNPIVDAPGKPGPHNSDTHLVMGPDGDMWMTYRMVDRPNGDLTRIFAVRSVNGTDWTDPVEIWTAKPGTNEAGFLSQALVWTGATWRLYGVRNAVSPNRLAYYETSDENPTAASSWTLVDCSIPGAGYGRNFWHVDVQIYNGEYLGIMQDMSRVGLDGDIYFMRSADGQAWERSMTPLVDKIGNRHTAIYKTGFVPSGSGSSLRLDLFYPGWVVTPVQRWAIFRTTATLANR